MGIKCPKCNIGVGDRQPLYRGNPKGVQGVFFCMDHLPIEYKPEALRVMELTELLHKDGQE